MTNGTTAWLGVVGSVWEWLILKSVGQPRLPFTYQEILNNGERVDFTHTHCLILIDTN